MMKLIDILKEVGDFDLSDNPIIPVQSQKLKRKFESKLPEIKLQVGTGEVKGRGKIYDIDQANEFIADDKSLTNLLIPDGSIGEDDLYSTHKHHISNFKRFIAESRKLSKVLGITWEKIAVFYYYNVEDIDLENGFYRNYYVPIRASLQCSNFGIKGKDSQNRELLYTRHGIYSSEGNSETLKLLTPGDIAPLYINQVKKALFPNDEIEAPKFQYTPTTDFKNPSKEDKEVLNNLRNNPENFPNVQMQVTNRIVREGPGLKGTYQILSKYLSKDAQANLVSYSNNLGVTWKNSIIFTNQYGNLLHATEGFDKDGRRYVFYKGDDGYSKIRGPL